MKDENLYPIAFRVRKLEDELFTDYMIGRMYEDQNLRSSCSQILALLKIARGYLVIGKERKAVRTYLSALRLKELIVKKLL